MHDRKVLITGTSSGIGLSLVNYLSSENYHVIALARKTEQIRKKFMDQHNVFIYEADLKFPEWVSEVVHQIQSEHGYIPFLINNAGVMVNSSIEEVSMDMISESFNVNCFSPIVIMRELLREMKKNNFGRIINITSGAPFNCSKNFGCYSSSKSALNTFTVTAAKEYQKYNIKINLMSPGPCKTKMAPNGSLPPSACHPTVKYLLNLDIDGPTGDFFWLGYKIPMFPELEGVRWSEGIASERFEKVI